MLDTGRARGLQEFHQHATLFCSNGELQNNDQILQKKLGMPFRASI